MVKLRRAVHNSNLRCPEATWMYIYLQANPEEGLQGRSLGWALTDAFSEDDVK